MFEEYSNSSLNLLLNTLLYFLVLANDASGIFYAIAVGIDLHHKVTITPPMESTVIQKYRQKELSFKKKDVHIINDDNDALPTPKESHYSNVLENSISMYVIHSHTLMIIK